MVELEVTIHLSIDKKERRDFVLCLDCLFLRSLSKTKGNQLLAQSNFILNLHVKHVLYEFHSQLTKSINM